MNQRDDDSLSWKVAAVLFPLVGAGAGTAIVFVVLRFAFGACV